MLVVMSCLLIAQFTVAVLVSGMLGSWIPMGTTREHMGFFRALPGVHSSCVFVFLCLLTKQLKSCRIFVNFEKKVDCVPEKS